MGFLQLEIAQFVVGLFIVIISYLLVVRHRKPLLDAVYGESKARKAFESLTSTGYFLVFVPILLFGINLTPPSDYNLISSLQTIIYFEAGLLFLIGILHLGVTVILSTSLKKVSRDKENDVT